MPAKGKHRRPKTGPLARGVIAVSVGSAAIALPLAGAANAQAAPQQQVTSEKGSGSAAPAASESTADTYSVVTGDSLFKIAQAHSISGGWEKLYEANRNVVGDDPSLILPGTELTLTAKAESSGSAPSNATQSSTASSSSYSDDLDGWIRESLDIMAQHGIPGTYEGIHRNIIRESGGDPNAVNNWDVNAQNGTPSKGLLQVIAPTFEAYHVPGTANDSLDPVANITAACNYAADRYGSIDNVNGPY